MFPVTLGLPVPILDDKRKQLFHDGSRYHIETSALICRANQWTGFNMITAFVMKELNSNFHTSEMDGTGRVKERKQKVKTEKE